MPYTACKRIVMTMNAIRIDFALTGAMGALSRKYAGRADLKELCAGFVAEFEKAMGCDSLNCAAIAPKYKTPERRCQAAVEVAADALEAYIARVDAE